MKIGISIKHKNLRLVKILNIAFMAFQEIPTFLKILHSLIKLIPHHYKYIFVEIA